MGTPLSARGTPQLPSDRSPPEMVVHAARLFHRGIICPTETWNVINDATANVDIVAILDGLDPVARDAVRGIHDERPESLEHLAATRDDSHFPSLLQWCLRSGTDDS